MERAVVLLATPKAAGGKHQKGKAAESVRHQENNLTDARIAAIQHQLVTFPHGNANQIK
jgi:hypothetical protein